MLIQGSALSNRTQILTDNYVSLLDKGIPASDILVLCQNPHKKSKFIEKVRKLTTAQFYESPQIYTFQGYVYNTIIENWPIIEESIGIGKTQISPHMTGLEISEILFKSAIKDVGFQDYNSKINLIHQLFRRYSLITNNALTAKDVANRSKILSESFAQDAQKAIDIYKWKTLEFRAFDYIRQLSLFNFIIDNPKYTNKIKYLFIDDADEITPFEFEFIKKIYPQLEEINIGYDQYGSSRMGYLNADTETVAQLEEYFSNEKKTDADNVAFNPIYTESKTYNRRLEMVYSAIQDAIKLLEKGVNPSEISIITPINDKSLKYAIKETFDNKNINYQFLTGSEKLVSTKLVKNIISVLKISIGINISVDDYRAIIAGVLKIPIKYCAQVLRNYKETGTICDAGLEIDSYKEKIKRFQVAVESISDEKMLMSDRIFYLLKNLVIIDKPELNETNTLAFFIKQIQDFEKVFEDYIENISFRKAVLQQLENSIISENPSTGEEIKNDSITISTVQKIIDCSIKTKYQFWLDVSSNEWTKDDLGTIYNAWVFQKSWKKKEFTYEDNLRYRKLKTQRQLRKLSMLTDNIQVYSSNYDIEGNENIGGIQDFFTTRQETKALINHYIFTPRDDQKAILEYKGGNLAISAVPGAGKTTVLLALIVNLLQSQTASENIFVLTYMDSAAKNFKERIKKAIPTLEKFPNISTIHGLALRILKENSNHTKIGLDSNFDVCDDNTRQKIIRESILKLRLEQEDYEKYEKAISLLKLSGTKNIPYVKDIEILKFLKLFNTYQDTLREQNLIDYDDMLVLSVQLLENNKDVCEYYQNICQYVIEDEAQDSSFIQQKLLNILSGKHKNLIRCGDINQSITTTFTNTDLDGFKSFVQKTKNIVMNQSQRCTKDIYTLANNLIDFARSEENLKNSFLDIKMSEVKGKNPISANAVCLKTFENYQEEQVYILEKLKEELKTNPDSSIAILVRNNYHIQEYAQMLTDNGYSIITTKDSLEYQPIFVLIYNILKFCLTPWNNKLVAQIAETLKNQNITNFNNEEINYIKNADTPFINISANEAKSNKLAQLVWDLNYWLETQTEDLESFAIKIGHYYYATELEKSNVYIIGLMLKKLYLQYKNTEILLEKLEEISKLPVMSKFKFFEEQENQENHKNTIQIMTYHKSKGDEFDCVFIPQLTEENLPFNIDNVKIKSKERFLENVKALNLNYRKKDEKAQKIFIAEENLRLLYVAITRAKRKLYLSSAQKYKKFSKIKPQKPSIIFDKMQNQSIK